jgi:hypothetical protein
LIHRPSRASYASQKKIRNKFNLNITYINDNEEAFESAEKKKQLNKLCMKWKLILTINISRGDLALTGEMSIIDADSRALRWGI